MKKFISLGSLLLVIVLFVSCGNPNATDEGKGNTQGMGDMSITAEEAKTIMDTAENYIILDVRTQEEFDEGHIPGATLIPYDKVENMSDMILPDKAQLILVYCRTGRRSKIAARTLAALGYTNIKEFGGVEDWQYDIVTG